MALNEIYLDADSLVFPVADTVKSGDLVQVGELVGVAENNAVTGEDGDTYATLRLKGAFKFETEDTFDAGSFAYHDGGVVVNDDTKKIIGHVIKQQGDSVVVRLDQSAGLEGPAGPAGPQGPAGEV
jgi:predicted RecA/RadA family phage recombinase